MNSNQIKIVLNKCSDENKDIKARNIMFYLFALIISILLARLNYSSLSIKFINLSLFFFISLSIGFHLINLFLNKLNLFYSIKSIKLAILKILSGKWDLETIRYIDSPVNLNPKVIKHPVTMYILGTYFVKNAYDEEGKYLIEKAFLKDSYLRNVNLNKLKEKEINYLVESIDKNINFSEKFKNYTFSKKYIKYTFIIILILFAILNLLSQILKIITD